MKPFTAVFNYLGRGELRSARRWLRVGCRILYVDSDPSCNVVGFEKLPSPRGIWPSSTLNLVEAIYRLRIEDSRSLIWATRLFGSEEIRYAFLQAITLKLLKFYSLMDSIGQVVTDRDQVIHLGRGRIGLRLPWDPFVFDFLRLERSGHLKQESAQIPVCVKAVMDRVRIHSVSRLHLFLLDLISPTRFLLCRLRLTKYPREHVHLAIHTYQTGLGVEEERPQKPNLRNVDFILDGVSFHEANTMFWADSGVPEIRIRALECQGYRVASYSTLRFDPGFLLCRALPALRDYLIYRVRMGIQDAFVTPICRELVRTYLQTLAFADYYSPRYFLLYNDFSYTSVGRTIALRTVGCCSVFYEHSSHSLIEGVSPDYGYLLYDAVATWSRSMTAYFQRPPGDFGESWEVGCIWSEHVRLVRESSEFRKTYQKQIQRYSQQSLFSYSNRIGVFDTTTNPVLFTPEDFFKFLSDIVWLASAHPDICFLYKSKWDLEYLAERFGKAYQARLEKLRRTPNVVVLPNLFETAAVIGLSDLTISVCFTSTLVESIGYGIPALYYDVSDRCHPSSEWGAFWHRIPKLICRDRKQLKERISDLLYNTSDEDYRNYLRRHLSHVEGYLDGRGITRLRERLASEIEMGVRR